MAVEISRELVRLLKSVASDDPPTVERYRILRRRLDQEIPMYDIRDLAEHNRQLRWQIDAMKKSRLRWRLVTPDIDAC